MSDPITDPIEEMNRQHLELILLTLAPEFYKLYTIVGQTHLNIDWLCRVIRGIHNISEGTGYGNVVIEIRNHDVNRLVNQETDKDV